MAEGDIEIPTPEGSMTTFVVHPDDGRPHPVVLFLMDAPGKRPLLHSMARRIAERGYYVMLPNLYYRATPEFQLDFASKDSFARMGELMRAVGNRMVARDAAVLLEHAERDAAADAARVGVVGYCMSGPFAVWVAAEFPDRVKAAASFYGVRLHTDHADSPHLRLGEIRGELYMACAEHDDYVPLDMVDRFEAAMQAAGTRGRVERYWGCHHGFAFDDRPQYDATAEQRHWDTLFDLFDRNVKPQMIVLAGTAEFGSTAGRDACLASSAQYQEPARTGEPGCLAYYFAPDPVVGTRMVVWELWADEASLRAHFGHENYRNMGQHFTKFDFVAGNFQKYRVDRVSPVYDATFTPRADFF